MFVPLFNSFINILLFIFNTYIFLLYINKEQSSKWFPFLKLAMAMILIGSFWQSLVSFNEAMSGTKIVTINDIPSLLRNLGFLLNTIFFINIYKNQ